MLQPEIRIDTMVHVLARDGIKIWHSLVEPIQGGVDWWDTGGGGKFLQECCTARCSNCG